MGEQFGNVSRRDTHSDYPVQASRTPSTQRAQKELFESSLKRFGIQTFQRALISPSEQLPFFLSPLSLSSSRSRSSSRPQVVWSPSSLDSIRHTCSRTARTGHPVEITSQPPDSAMGNRVASSFNEAALTEREQIQDLRSRSPRRRP